MVIKDGTTRSDGATVTGKCNFCTLSCGHRYVSSEMMPKYVHEVIDKLESGCGHIKEDTHVICDSCRDLTVTILWQLAKGERVG